MRHWILPLDIGRLVFFWRLLRGKVYSRPPQTYALRSLPKLPTMASFQSVGKEVNTAKADACTS